MINKIIFNIGYYTLKLWLFLAKREIESQNGVSVTELSVTISAFPIPDKTEILVNGEPYID